MTAGAGTKHEAVSALEQNLWSLWANFGRGPGCSLVEEPGLLRFDTPIAQVPYNAVLRFHGGPDADSEIDSIVAHYHERAVPLLWIVHPTSGPPDLPERLERRGLVEAERVLGMIGRLDALPARAPFPEGIEVIEAGTREDEEVTELVTWRYALGAEAAATLRAVYRVLGVGSPTARTRIWVARRGGDAVSKVVLHVGAGVAGIYGVATKPEARGLGLARSMTLQALEAARTMGTEVAILHSTPMAVGLYKAIGFEPVADFRLFAEPGSLHL